MKSSLKSSEKPEKKSPELVEIVDASNKPFAVIPLNEAHKQTLPHRAVLVLVYDTQNKVYLQKRSQQKSLYPGRYDLSATGHVRAGEALEEAALRELNEELGIDTARLKLIHELPASVDTGHEFITLFSAGRITQPLRPNPEELDGGMFVDRDELNFLVENYRDMLTPGVVYFAERNLIFPQSA